MNKKTGAKQKTMAYCHVVGLGLGVWELSSNQGTYMVQEFSEVLSTYEFPYISDINFSWFPAECCQWWGKQVNLGKSPMKSPRENQSYNVIGKKNNQIKVHFSKRNPAESLSSENTDKVQKLLVAMYAWDSNSFPGNEYWIGKLNASGDPAAACCSTIAELQNTMINQNFQENIEIIKRT